MSPEHESNAATQKRSWIKFFLVAATLTVALISAWRPVAGHVSSPVSALTEWVLETWFDDTWLYRIQHQKPSLMELETRLKMTVAADQFGQLRALPREQWGEISLEVDGSRYGYGVPLLLALLIAARTRHLVRKFMIGWAVLIPTQVFTNVVFTLREVAFIPGVTPQLGYASWQIEVIAYLYQFGVLLAPTISPIIVWLALDGDVRHEWRDFFNHHSEPKQTGS